MQQASQSKHELIRNSRQNQQDREWIIRSHMLQEFPIDYSYMNYFSRDWNHLNKVSRKSTQNDSLGLHCMLNTTTTLSIMISRFLVHYFSYWKSDFHITSSQLFTIQNPYHQKSWRYILPKIKDEHKLPLSSNFNVINTPKFLLTPLYICAYNI